MRAHDLRERMAFDRRVTTSDSAGNFEGAWAEQFSVAARVRHLRGGEDVMASRLQGRQPAVVTVRASALTRMISTDWRARDVRSGAVYAVTAITPDERGEQIDLLCTAGVAA